MYLTIGAKAVFYAVITASGLVEEHLYTNRKTLLVLVEADV